MKTVRVVCDEVAHPGKSAVVAVLKVTPEGVRESPDSRTSDRAMRLAWDAAERFDAGKGDWPDQPEDRASALYVAADGHRRWRFACPLCNLTVPARDDKLWPVLVDLAYRRVAQIGLRELASKLQ